MKKVLMCMPRSGSTCLATNIRDYSSENLVLEFHKNRVISPQQIKELEYSFYKLVIHNYSKQDVIDIVACNHSMMLYRKNICESVVSLRLAEQTSMWQAVGSQLQSYRKKQIMVSIEILEKRYNEYLEYYDIMRSLSKNTPAISYEELYTNTRVILKYISEFFDIDLDIDSAIQHMDSKRWKLNDYSNISNIDEVNDWIKSKERIIEI